MLFSRSTENRIDNDVIIIIIVHRNKNNLCCVCGCDKAATKSKSICVLLYDFIIKYKVNKKYKDIKIIIIIYLADDDEENEDGDEENEDGDER